MKQLVAPKSISITTLVLLMYPRIFMDLPLEFSDIVPSESICKPSSASASSSSKGCESQNSHNRNCFKGFFKERVFVRFSKNNRIVDYRRRHFLNVLSRSDVPPNDVALQDQVGESFVVMFRGIFGVASGHFLDIIPEVFWAWLGMVLRQGRRGVKHGRLGLLGGIRPQQWFS
ncbi:unnamed protein product [Arabidopsis thaliana]|uniref:Uncharacterized protein n=1 Tax=Arabidopsis thaliana TaxID=3702 RepID=A0A654FCG1_ARATH|nr:unnamed protein product [Arabidopsis thaliana]